MPQEGTPRVALSVNKKLELISKLEAGASVKSVCEEYGVKKQTVSDIRKAKDRLLAFSVKYDVMDNSENSLGSRKRMRLAKDEKLEEAVTKWLVQQRSFGVKVPGIAIQAAAQKLAMHLGITDFAATDGWLWRYRKRHGMVDKVLHVEVAIASNGNVESFRQRLNNLIRHERLLISQVYNADESGLLWHCLPKNTEAFKDQRDIHGEKMSKERISFLCCANGGGLHRLPLVVVGKSKPPRVLKDCMDHLSLIYYSSTKAWFSMEIFKDWFFKHFVPSVRKFQEEVLKLNPEDVKALLLLDHAPVHPSESVLVSQDGKIRVMFLPVNVSSLIQPMEQAVIVSCKRAYQRKYLDEIYCVDVDDRKSEKIKQNIKNYNIKGAIFNISSAWNTVKPTTLANAWNDLLYAAEGMEHALEGLKPNDFYHAFKRAGEEVSLADVRGWLEDTDGEAGHHLMTDEEIIEDVLQGNAVEEDDGDEELDVQAPKLSKVQGSLDRILTYIDLAGDKECDQYYRHFRAFRDLIIQKQRKQQNRVETDSFFTPGITQLDSHQVSPPEASTSIISLHML